MTSASETMTFAALCTSKHCPIVLPPLPLFLPLPPHPTTTPLRPPPAWLNSRRRESILIWLITCLITYNPIFIQCRPCLARHTHADLWSRHSDDEAQSAPLSGQKTPKMFHIITKILCPPPSLRMLSAKGQACHRARARVRVCVCVRGGLTCWIRVSWVAGNGNDFSHAFTVIWIVLLKQIWLHISFERYSNRLSVKLPSNTGALCSPARLITGPWSSSLSGCGRTLSTFFFFFSPSSLFIVNLPPPPKCIFDYGVIWASFCHLDFARCV